LFDNFWCEPVLSLSCFQACRKRWCRSDLLRQSLQHVWCPCSMPAPVFRMYGAVWKPTAGLPCCSIHSR
jgi:hypothetical protein